MLNNLTVTWASTWDLVPTALATSEGSDEHVHAARKNKILKIDQK